MKSVLAAICLACSVSCAELPVDTKIEIRLKTKVSSNASKPHDPLEAIVIPAVFLNDQCIIPIDATLRGEGGQGRIPSCCATSDPAAVGFQPINGQAWEEPRSGYQGRRRG